MSTHPVIPRETQSRQAEAADPVNSVWVSANAGSGKTYVLSRRVIRLLLQGVDPSRILCLTYTRAAAANMVNKVFDDLGRWAMMDDQALIAAIADLEGRSPDAKRISRARQLFARALETPGGLKIQTIHAFCEAVLHQFPLEANIAGHFELLDSQLEFALITEARRELLTGINAGEDAELAAAFGLVLTTAGEHGLNGLLADIVAEREGLSDWLREIGGYGGGLLRLKEEFKIEPDETPELVAASVWPDGYFTAAMAENFKSRGEQAGRVRASDFGANLKRAIDVPATQERFEALCTVFLRWDKGRWAARSVKGIASKGVGEHFPGFDEEFYRYADVLLKARNRLDMLTVLEATDAALTVADRLIARYERLKSARGFLDFKDLISRTANLLARQDAGAWVQYKLDRGLDHILIDEAQDTSPGQWTVIKALAEEFFTGQSAREDENRTVFAVGDEKQSIYSFQGAEPAAFAESGQSFAGKVSAAGRSFHKVKLHHSFRSVDDVLSAVDLVFKSDTARQGLTIAPEEIIHSAVRAGDPGYVEIWPLIGVEKTADPDDWTQAIDHTSEPAVRLAETIAAHIRGWIDHEELIEGTGKRLSPGDIMVLVRKRDSFVHALSRALKNHDIAVAGADRLKLRDHIAVKDLIALGRFVIQPNDDLSLAALLKSPVFNLSEDDLYDLASNRGTGTSLWQSLQSAGEHQERFKLAAARLSRWRREAENRQVVDFYSAILGSDGIRAAMVGRLGREAGEIIDEFVAYIFDCEKAGILGLGAFLETLEIASPEIKREIAQTRDEVRIMTVHAAKGLEAPVVFLVDNGSEPFSHQHLPRLIPFQPQSMHHGAKGYLWRMGGGVKPAFIAELETGQRAKAEEEYRRLLYVGMTRAEDRLVVCGYHGVKEPKAEIWHRLVHAGLAGTSVPVADGPAGFEGEVLRYRSTKSPARPAKPVELEKARPVAFPDDLRQPLPPEISLPRPFAPSGAAALIEPRTELISAENSPVLATAQKPRFAIERGIAIHHLLQILPQMASGKREEAALGYLLRRGASWQPEERRSALASVMRVLDDPRFAPVFAENSRAEVEIAGHLKVAGNTRAVSGKIDRLALGADEVLIIDYKTNRTIPASLEQIPAGYVAQLAVYAALIGQIYPRHAVRAGLLFTEAAAVFELPDTMMQESLEHLAVS